jgi:TolB-like protein
VLKEPREQIIEAARRGVDFGRFSLDLTGRRLSCAGDPVKLSSRALDILCELAVARGEVVDKDRLLERVWRGRSVEENAIQVHVSALRKSLEAGGDGQSYIVTVPGRGYRLVGIHASAPPQADLSTVRPKIPGTSVAVLRFVNLSGDPEQDFFADGIVEDIITGLSRIGGVFVIASKSSFVFDGDSPDFAKIGRELSCRYLVRGSVRKADKRIRITARLLEAETGISIWAERYDRRLDDIFEVQDAIAMSLIGAIEPNLRKAEIGRVRRQRPDSFDAYDLVLQAQSTMRTTMPIGASEAIPFLQKALQLEPDYAAAHAHLSRCYQIRFSRQGLNEPDRQAAVRHARAAIRSDDATALGTAALVIWFADPDFAAAFDVFERALSISGSNVVSLGNSAFVYALMGRGGIAIERAKRALELSPFDTLIAYMAIAVAEFHAGRFEEARAGLRPERLRRTRISASRAFC